MNFTDIKIGSRASAIYPTEEAGLYVRELADAEFETFVDDVDAADSLASKALVLFERVLCDDQGERFKNGSGGEIALDDCKAMGTKQKQDIIDAGMNVFIPKR